SCSSAPSDARPGSPAGYERGTVRRISSTTDAHRHRLAVLARRRHQMAAVLVEGRGLTRRAEHLAALGTGPLEVLVGHSAPHRLAQRGDRRFSLAHQAVCSIRCLTGLLDELPGGVARLPRPLTHLLGQHRATVEMAAHTLGQIHTTARAEVGTVTKKLGA